MSDISLGFKCVTVEVYYLFCRGSDGDLVLKEIVTKLVELGLSPIFYWNLPAAFILGSIYSVNKPISL